MAPKELLSALPGSQAGPERHKCVVCAYEAALAHEDANAERPIHAEEVSEADGYREGAVRQVKANAYERNPVARRRCIEHYGTACVVCGLAFEAKYGEIGAGFIHVHHLRPLSELGKEYHVDPIADLRPVCPNCHAMLHQQKPPFSIEELRAMLNK